MTLEIEKKFTEEPVFTRRKIIKLEEKIADFECKLESFELLERKLDDKFQCNGIPDSLLMLLQDFLHNRKQRVILNDQASEWQMVSSGVPQGSELDPLLFLVYINDIVDNINCDIGLFADDTSL